jgi:3-deoxy-D-manno-octulosonic-acid transferase
VVNAGDSRFDRVLLRIGAHNPLPPGIEQTCAGRQVLVAGSTHPDDEELILPVIPRLKSKIPGFLAVIVPHDPSGKARRRILSACRQYGLKMSDLDAKDAESECDVLLVNRSGILADLYRTGQVAYVGGGFGKGVHSVLEPMASGLPVICGPRISVSHEARVASQEEILAVVKNRNLFEKSVTDWLSDSPASSILRARVRAFVEARAGVAARIAARLKEAVVV